MIEMLPNRLPVQMLERIEEHRALSLASEIAFWGVLSLLPSLLSLVSLLGFIEPLAGPGAAETAESAVTSALRTVLGDDSEEPVRAITQLFDANRAGGTAVIGLLVALFSMSRGFHAVIGALDQAYSVRHRRNWFGVRALALVLALGSLVVAAAACTLLVVLPKVVDDVPGGTAVWAYVRPAIAALLVFGWALTLYRIAPNHHVPLRFDLPGALVASVGWLLTGLGFGVYVRWASGGGTVVGALSGVLSLLVVLYLFAVVLLIGGELNAILAHHHDIVVPGRPMPSTTDQILKVKDWATGRNPVVRLPQPDDPHPEADDDGQHREPAAPPRRRASG
jgi:membrane protein